MSANDKTWVILKRKSQGGKWRVFTRTNVLYDSVQLNFDESIAQEKVNLIVSKCVIGIEDPIWQLEIAKYAERKLTRPLAIAQMLQEEASVTNNNNIAMFCSEPKVVIYALRRLLSVKQNRLARGLRCAQDFVVACIILFSAFILFWYMIVRNIRFEKQLKPESDFMIGLYGERSNRTNHLLYPKFDITRPCYLIVGRIKSSLKDIALEFDPDNNILGKFFFRPIGCFSALKSLPAALRCIIKGFGYLHSAPVLIPFYDRLAICFRFFQGAAYQEWWRASELKPAVVAFGQTGLADTTMLEFAIQEGGGKTVHCVHGVNLGWNFAGYSDVGLFVSGYDAKLAEQFPSYKATKTLPNQRPTAISGGYGWVLLTSYSHPINPIYKKNGPDADIQVMNMVAEAAKSYGYSGSHIVWRPHPAFSKLKQEDQDALNATAKSHGFKMWPSNKPYETLAEYSRIFTTPSTVAIDALRLGKIPIILAPVTGYSDMVYSHFPLASKNIEMLQSSLLKIDGVKKYNNVFQAIWKIVLPGPPVYKATEIKKICEGNEKI